MSIFRHDTLGSWTRGGQAIVHNVRMTTQVFYQTFLAGLVIWIGGTLWYALEKSSEYERFVMLKVTQAYFMGDTLPGNSTPILFKTPAGKQYWTTPKGLVSSGVAHKTLAAFETYLLHGALLSGLFALTMLGWAWFYFTRTGRGLGSNQFLRGARFGTVRQVRRTLWRYAKGSFDIGVAWHAQAHGDPYRGDCGVRLSSAARLTQSIANFSDAPTGDNGSTGASALFILRVLQKAWRRHGKVGRVQAVRKP